MFWCRYGILCPAKYVIRLWCGFRAFLAVWE
jgi:hypothetical protein